MSQGEDLRICPLYIIYCRATTCSTVVNRAWKSATIQLPEGLFPFCKAQMSAIRILVVDDHEVIRRVVCSLLSSDPTLDVVCQTADGEQAVLKAQELHPDLVLLDISLPGISGIEAARRIRSSSPNSHIIFLSQHDSLQVVESAMRIGGHGYVAKIDAGSELLNAIRSVNAGEQFVSQRILSQGWRMDRPGRAETRENRN